MKKQENKSIIIVILTLILIFSMLLRLDINNNYPKGADTYELYALANNIKEKGYVVWNINILTVLGFTSVSYPPGGIIFLLELSQITGINITTIIMIWNFFFVIICGLLIYLTSKTIFKNNFLSILAVLIYLNSRFFISYSTYFTSRNIIHIFFLATFFILLKNIRFRQVILLLILLGISFITHRATILVFIFLMAIIISKIVFRYYKNKSTHNLFIASLTSGLFLLSAYIFEHASVGSETSKIPFKIGINYLDSILSILFSISMHFGALIVFAFIGYFFLVTRKDKTLNDFFILIVIILSSAFLVETIYFFYLFLPIIVLLTAYFLEKIYKSNINIIKYGTTFLIIIALILPLFITIRESKSDLVIVKEQTIKTISYLENENIQKKIACNNHAIYCSHISALGNNVTALTYTSVRTMIDRIKLTQSVVNLGSIRSKIIIEDDILKTSLFSDSYTSAIIRWNTPPPIMKKLVEFTNLGYILDSNNLDSNSNRAGLEKKFKYMNLVYDNGLQQVKVIQ